MKCSLFLFVLGFSIISGTVFADDGEDLQCGIKTCAISLLNFGDMSFSSMIKKVHVATFCIRECSPPAVHEFFQSITYAITRRIPGYCAGKACIEVNRFVGLAHCMENRSWPLVQCATKLVDLAQLSLEPILPGQHRNKTCSIMVETIKCVEKNIEKCGEKPYSLVQEIFGKVTQLGMNLFCRVHYNKDGDVVPFTEPPTSPQPSTTPRIPAFFKPVAKGFLKHDPNSSVKLEHSLVCVLGVIVAMIVNLRSS